MAQRYPSRRHRDDDTVGGLWEWPWVMFVVNLVLVVAVIAMVLAL